MSVSNYTQSANTRSVKTGLLHIDLELQGKIIILRFRVQTLSVSTRKSIRDRPRRSQKDREILTYK